MKALIVKEDGLIYVNEVPEEPKWHQIPATPDSSDYEIRDEQREEYEKAIASAKDSAILVSDQEKAMDLLVRRHSDGNLLQQFKGVYPMDGLEWSTFEKEFGTGMKTFAILKESTPSTEQESQEELLQAIFDMAQGEIWTYERILKTFTITRKP